jgi:hypothetical protein
MEIPANLRLKYWRLTQTHLPTGEAGVIEFKRVFEAYTVLTRKVLFEKYKTNPHLVTSIGGVVKAYVVETEIDNYPDFVKNF